MAEIVDKYIIDTKEAQANLKGVEKGLTDIAAQSKKVASQVNTDFMSAARGGQALTKQYNGLNIAVSQFARELPNAAISAQTFFISISNQFGQLQDAIQRINAQNRELAAQGQKTIPVFKQIASSIFSLSTALNLGVLVLVLYGKEIGNLLSSLFKGSAAIDQAKKSFETLNKAFESKSVLKAVSDIQELRNNIDLARRGFLDKQDVIDQYNKSIGETTGQITSLDQAEQALVKNGAAYIQLTLLKASANLANEEAAQASVDAMKETLKEEERLRNDSTKRIIAGADAETRGLQQFSEIQLQTEIKARREASQKRIADLQEVAQRFTTQAATLATQNGFDFFGDLTQDEAARKAAERKAIENLREFWRLYELEAAKVRPGRLQATPIEGATPVGLPEGLLPSTADISVSELSINELFERLFEARKNKDKEYTAFLEAELKRRVDNYQKSLDEQKQADEIYANGVRDIQQQLADGIFQLRAAYAQQGADAQIEQLEKERDAQLENEKLTVEERAAIQEEFDRKRSDILNKNARIQRQFDLAQILVNTALAIMKAFATAPNPLAAGALAEIYAIEGGLQYALAAAQPLPQFAKGTDMVTGGIQGKDSVRALLMPKEAVIPAKENLKHPGLATAWINGNLDQFIAMKYIEPALAELQSKEASKINQTFINNNKGSNMSDKRIVKGLQENALINRMMLKQMMKENRVSGNRRFWN